MVLAFMTVFYRTLETPKSPIFTILSEVKNMF